MADGLDEEQLDEYGTAFSMFDKNNDGNVDERELGFLMRYLGQNPSEGEVLEMMKNFGSGNVMSKNNFMAMMTQNFRQCDTDTSIIEAFQVFDKDGRGFINTTELRHLLTNMGEKLDEHLVESMMRDSIASDEGNIDYKSFVATMMKK
mmetsp:Transcript_22051/g.55340  ORF Transcript_22051/g.55340 Transcript_22051/m.55340 type:complete len:148 (-) Transcript_22051:169-612(-)|eukprot:CAMPEP_0177632442 /NCGR_PEP_ID=MMETSP0447-20121125/2292_1 /TAXON_ID=0 /ORGANISM="Stygamoeba regulata, Strain BSH-02190019" /LENGTH=147 /DNA_ID=CAMNT_0019134007 /DNA_START=40 /DNA_END=483 /DNA_ORIENTATION=-